MFRLALCLSLLPAGVARAAEPPKWLMGTAHKLPSEATNQESGYFSIVEGKNRRLYVGAAKYGVNAYLLEFDPATGKTRTVVDAMKLIGSTATGMAAQAKFHTRNNVGTSGTVYAATKQGYPEKGDASEYPGGYVVAYDPATEKARHFGLSLAGAGIISVMPDEARGVAYLSTCRDRRPVDETRFLVLDLKTNQITDLGDMAHHYAFIVLDARGRAYHPVRGGTVARYDPDAKRLDRLNVTLDGKPAPDFLKRDDTILNWDATPDRKTLYSVEMSTNALMRFDLSGDTLSGVTLGPLLKGATKTDCRALCVGPTGTAWMAVTDHGRPGGPLAHLVSYAPGDAAPRDHGPLGVANPDYVRLTDADGKPKPWHHTLRKEADGTLTPWQPLGICEGSDGVVNVVTIAPFTLVRVSRPRGE